VTAIVGFAVALVPVVGLIFTASMNRRAQYDRVLEVTALLTSGDVAESRHAAGLKFEAFAPSPPATITNPVVNLTEEELKALFHVLWSFERINGLFVSLQRSWLSFRLRKAQKLLLDVSASAITIWNSYTQFEVRDLSGKKYDLAPSKDGLVNLAEKLQIISHVKNEHIQIGLCSVSLEILASLIRWFLAGISAILTFLADLGVLDGRASSVVN
jgi:hypothetical protein